MQASERLYLTADKSRIVSEGDPAAAFLYAAPGDEIPQSACDRFGLVDGGIKRRKDVDDKRRRDGADKSFPGTRESEEGGGGGAGADGTGAAVPLDDLTRIKGIGPATAGKLRAAGIVTFDGLAAAAGQLTANLAALASGDEWNDWARQARELAGG